MHLRALRAAGNPPPAPRRAQPLWEESPAPPKIAVEPREVRLRPDWQEFELTVRVSSASTVLLFSAGKPAQSQVRVVKGEQAGTAAAQSGSPGSSDVIDLSDSSDEDDAGDLLPPAIVDSPTSLPIDAHYLEAAKDHPEHMLLWVGRGSRIRMR